MAHSTRSQTEIPPPGSQSFHESILAAESIASDERWCVVHTRPRNEKALAGELERLSIPFYLPLHQRTTRSRSTGRRHQSIVPVFSGYLFVRATPDQRYRALRTQRIVNLIEVADQVRLVRELRQIEKVLQSPSAFQWHKRLQAGDWVRVIAGTLMGLEGVVYKRLTKSRVVLNVNTLGQSISVEIPEDLLETIDPPAYARP